MTTPLGIAVVGLGGIAQRVHIPNLLTLQFTENPPVRLVGLYDLRPGLAARVAATIPGTRAYQSLDELLADPDVEAVMVCTPEAAHAAPSLAALQAGKHVFVEKPISDRFSEARAIVESSRKAGRVALVGFMMRHDADCQETRKLLEAGSIGRPLTCSSVYVKPMDIGRYYQPPIGAEDRRALVPAPRSAPDHPDDQIPSGVPLGGSIHYLNLLRWWFGDVESVWADVEDTRPLIVLRFRSGVLATQIVAGVGEGIRESLITGQGGYIRTRLRYPGIPLDFGRTVVFSVDDPVLREPVFPRHDMFQEELRHFAACCRGEAVPISSAEDSLWDLAVLRAAYRSHRERREVEVESPW